jgi:hypothetical protein
MYEFDRGGWEVVVIIIPLGVLRLQISIVMYPGTAIMVPVPTDCTCCVAGSWYDRSHTYTISQEQHALNTSLCLERLRQFENVIELDASFFPFRVDFALSTARLAFWALRVFWASKIPLHLADFIESRPSSLATVTDLTCGREAIKIGLIVLKRTIGERVARSAWAVGSRKSSCPHSASQFCLNTSAARGCRGLLVPGGQLKAGWIFFAPSWSRYWIFVRRADRGIEFLCAELITALIFSVPSWSRHRII